MSIARVLFLAALVFLGFTRDAAAETVLTTPRLTKPTVGDIFCTLVNVGTKDLSVTFDIVRFDGVVAASSPFTVIAGGTYGYGANSIPAGYCRFSFKGSKNTVRASGCILAGGVCTPVVDAR